MVHSSSEPFVLVSVCTLLSQLDEKGPSHHSRSDTQTHPVLEQTHCISEQTIPTS